MRYAFKSLVFIFAFSTISDLCAAEDFTRLAHELVSANKIIANKAHKKLNGLDRESKILLITPLIKTISSKNDIQSRQRGIFVVTDITPDLPLAIQTKRVVPFLAKVFILEGKRIDSDAARSSLIKLGKPAMPYLMSLMRHTGSSRHAFEREKVLSLLETHVQNNNKEIIAELVAYLDDKTELGREGVVLVLRKLKPSNAQYVPKLIMVFNEPRNKMLRSHIAEIFSNMGAAAIEASPSLIVGLQAKEDENLRRVSATALGNVGRLEKLDKLAKPYPDTVAVLMNALHDPSCDVRTNAMESLKRIGVEKGLSAVKQYKESKRYCNKPE